MNKNKKRNANNGYNTLWVSDLSEVRDNKKRYS